jgi:ornithine carbamoyltransferase
MKRDYVNENDWAPREIESILARAAEVKKGPGRYRGALAGRTLAMIFEKSSTRTRVSFEAGMFQLGGIGMFLSSRDLQLGRGEPISDTARVLSRYVDAIMARVFAQATVDGLAKHASIPVIKWPLRPSASVSGLADFQTVQERFGGVRVFHSVTWGTGTTWPTAFS